MFEPCTLPVLQCSDCSIAGIVQGSDGHLLQMHLDMPPNRGIHHSNRAMNQGQLVRAHQCCVKVNF